MPGPTPPPVVLTDPLRGVLERLARRHTSPQRLVRRLQIVLAAAAGGTNEAIARQHGVDRGTVCIWRARWLAAAPRLDAAVAAGEDDRVLARLVSEALADAPRPGAPPTFSAEPVVQIVAIACEPPPRQRAAHQPLDPAGSGRRSDQTRHRPGPLPPLGGALFKGSPN